MQEIKERKTGINGAGERKGRKTLRKTNEEGLEREGTEEKKTKSREEEEKKKDFESEQKRNMRREMQQQKNKGIRRKGKLTASVSLR